MFPDVFEEYVNGAKNPETATDEYFNKIMKCSNKENCANDEIRKVSKYEETLMALDVDPRTMQRKFTKKDICLAKLEAHYFNNRCFIRDILNKVHKIRHIPMIIVQGRYDAVTPAFYAYELHKMLPKSKIYFTIAGHRMREEENFNKVREIFGGI